MASDNSQAPQLIPTPNSDLKSLDRLVGTWNVSGGAQGQTVYEWMEGGFFLIQHVDFGTEKGIEIIGHEQNYGEDPSVDIKSRYYDTKGNTFEYVYELESDTLMIWFGEKDSPAYYKGTFSADGKTLTGEWVYPGGGGYKAVSKKME